MKLIVLCAVAVFMSAVELALAAPPDLTAGGVPDSTRTQNLGPTGARGWVYVTSNNEGTIDARQIQVQIVDPGSPAAGILATNDVILGADGTGASATAFTYDARKALAAAIADAEARDPATLDLLVWRSGVTSHYQLTLQTMGAYSATAPYNCPKSANILEQGLDYFFNNGDAGRANFGLLTLLASTNTSYYARAETEARELIPTAETMAEMMAGVRSTASAWNRGYELLTLSQYYLATGDTNVLPAVEARATEVARNQSLFGTLGHIYADKNPDGSDNGPMGGHYGVINTPGLACFIGLLLTQESGVTNAYITAAIERTSRFFAYYAGKGSVPYGEHTAYANFGGSNGKNALAALCFALQTNRVEECNFFSKLCTAASEKRESGHTGPFFEYLWGPLGANVGGEEAMASYFNRIKWHLDLQRRWNGSFAYDNLRSDGGEGNGSDYASFDMGAAILLTYATPHRRLHITGANPDPVHELTSGDVADTEWAASYDPTTRLDAELISDLENWAPPLVSAAANELGSRTIDTTELDQIIAMAVDTNGIGRAGACEALGKIGNTNAIDELAVLLTDSENNVRFHAADAMRFFGGRSVLESAGVIDDILSAAATTAQPLWPMVEEDPVHFAHGRLCMLLFYGGNAYGPKGVLYSDMFTGIDTNLLYPAIEAVAATPAGQSRSTVGSAYAQIDTPAELPHLLAVAGAVVDGIHWRAPADKMFSAGVRTKGLELLERYGIAEGIPLAPIAIDDQASQLATECLGTLEAYAGACLNVTPDPDVLGYIETLFDGTHDAAARSAYTAIINDASPYVPTPFKSIQSVSADVNPITLSTPTVSTTLRVNGAHDYAEGDSIFTWRKIHGASPLDITPNGTAESTNVTAVFNTPGLHKYEMTMSDSRGLTEVVTQLLVTVYNSSGELPTNDPPTADPQTVSLHQDLTLDITLTGSDPEGFPLVFSITTPPTHGTILGTGSNVVYQPDAFYMGPDSFEFEVMDSDGQTDTAIIDVGVYPASIQVDGVVSCGSPIDSVFDASGSDKLVVVISGEHGFANTGAGRIYGITYDGQPMVEAVYVMPSSPIGPGTNYVSGVQHGDIASAIYYLDNPGAYHTNGTIAVSVNGGSFVYTAIGLSGTANGVGPTVSTTMVSSVDLTTVDDNSLVIFNVAMGGGGNTATPLPGVTATSPTGDGILTYTVDGLEYGANYAGHAVGRSTLISAAARTYSFDTSNDDVITLAVAFEPNDIPPEVSFVPATAANSETVSAVNGSLVLSRVYNDTVTVEHRLAAPGGTATDGVDFSYTSDTVVFAAGQTNMPVTFTVINDTEEEPDETVILELGAISNGVAGASDTFTYTIQSDPADVPPTVTFVPATDAGPETVGSATGMVVLSHSHSRTVTVEPGIAAASTATEGLDFTYAGTPLVFNPGETNKTFTFSVIDDTDDDPGEVIVFEFASISNGLAGVESTFTYTIESDPLDVPPTVTFTPTADAAPETVGSATGMVVLSHIHSRTVTVEPGIAVASTATEGLDFTYGASPLVFSPGETNKTFAFTVIDDTDNDPGETIVFEFASISNGVPGVADTFTYTIQADPLDVQPAVTFSPTTGSGAESTPGVIVEVILSKTYSGTTTVEYVLAPAGTTATPDADFTFTSGQLTFDPGVTNQSFSFSVIDDTDDESAETAAFTFGTIGNGAAGVADTFTYTIQVDPQDTPPMVSFAPAEASGSESMLSVTGNVTLSWVYSSTVTVVPGVAAGGTAAEGQDFNYVTNALIFNPGETNMTFAFSVIDDGDDEPDETILFELASISNAVPGVANTYTYTILSDSNDWYGIPFFEPFEVLTLGALNGQHGWIADSAVVQDSVTYGGSSGAGAVTNDVGSARHTFNDGPEKVWIDTQLQMTFRPELPVLPADSSAVFYVSTNGFVMAFDGTNAVPCGPVVAEDQWVRYTLFCDYVTASWVLYVDGVRTGRYRFYNADNASFRECLALGSITYVDNLAITTDRPDVPWHASVITVR